MVGIEANYGTNIVPYDLGDYLFNSFGISITAVYSDGTKEKISLISKDYPKITCTKTSTVYNDNGCVITYNVTYQGFTDVMTIQYLYTESVYPISQLIEYDGEDLEKEEDLLIDNIKISLTFTDDSTSIADVSSLRVSYVGVSETNDYHYLVLCDYYFTDDNGNEFYICVDGSSYLYIPIKE